MLMQIESDGEGAQFISLLYNKGCDPPRTVEKMDLRLHRHEPPFDMISATGIPQSYLTLTVHAYLVPFVHSQSYRVTGCIMTGELIDNSQQT